MSKDKALETVIDAANYALGHLASEAEVRNGLGCEVSANELLLFYYDIQNAVSILKETV